MTHRQDMRLSTALWDSPHEADRTQVETLRSERTTCSASRDKRVVDPDRQIDEIVSAEAGEHR